MKKSYYYLLLTSITLFTSCSNHEDPVSTDTSGKAVETQYARDPNSAANTANPYDAAGQIFIELYRTYYANYSRGASVSVISSRVNTIALQNSAFVSLAGTSYAFTSTSRVDYILGHISTCTPEIINSSLAGTAARTSLSNFVSSYLVLFQNESNYDVIYDYVAGYEASVIANSAFSPSDKKVILITTSVARFVADDRKKKPKRNTDPEWDLMVGNVMATIEGSTTSTENAIAMSLITGIAENN